MWRTVQTGLLIAVFSLLTLSPETAGAQAFEPWRNAVVQQFPGTDAVLRSRDISISFHSRRRGEPEVRLHYRLRFSFTGQDQSGPSIPYTIRYDEHGTLDHLKAGRNRIRRQALEGQPYSSGALLHSNVLEYDVDIRAKRKYQERTLRYTISIDDLRYLPPIYLTDGYATYQSALEINVPEWMNIEAVPFHMSDTTRFEQESSVDAKNARTLRYTASLLPPIHDLDRMPGPSHMLPHVLLLPKAMLRQGRWQPIFPDLNALYQWYDSLMQAVDKTVEWPEALASGDPSAAAIFNWVRDNIRYLAFEGGIAGYTPEAPATVMAQRYSDCKGMALLTTQLLREAGYTAYPGWMATRYLIYDYNHPCLAADNHMISVAVVEGDTLYLDPTNPAASFGEYDFSLSGKEVLAGTGASGERFRVPPLDSTLQQLKYTYRLNLSGEGRISGNGRIEASGAPKLSLLRQLAGVDDLAAELRAVCHLPGAALTVPASVGNDIRPGPGVLQIPFDLYLPESLEIFDEQMYLQPRQLGVALPQPINERRPWPVSLREAGTTTWTWNISVGDGAGQPLEPYLRSWSSDCLDVRWEVSSSEGMILLGLTVYLPSPDVPVSCFREWNTILTEVNAILDTYLVLNK